MQPEIIAQAQQSNVAIHQSRSLPVRKDWSNAEVRKKWVADNVAHVQQMQYRVRTLGCVSLHSVTPLLVTLLTVGSIV